jgi:hypothetical protein
MGSPALPPLLLLLLRLWLRLLLLRLLLRLHWVLQSHARFMMMYTRLLLLIVPRVCWRHHQRQPHLVYI